MKTGRKATRVAVCMLYAALASLLLTILSSFCPEKAFAEVVEVHLLASNDNAGILYTSDMDEMANLVGEGWVDRGVAWLAPDESDLPVFRLYQPDTDRYYFCCGPEERDALIEDGWRDEGIGWYSAYADSVPVYSLYNPETALHFYTTSGDDLDEMLALKWVFEGEVFYAVKAGNASLRSDVALSVGEAIQVDMAEGDRFIGVFTAPEDGFYTFSSVGGGDDVANVYSDQHLSRLIDSDDDSGENLNFFITRNMMAGETVYLEVLMSSDSTESILVVVRQITDVWSESIVGKTENVELGDGERLVAPFEVEENGEYLVEVSASEGVIAELYTNDGLSRSVWWLDEQHYDEGCRWRCELSAGSTYWLVVHGEGYGMASFSLGVKRIAIEGIELSVGEPKRVEIPDGSYLQTAFAVPDDGEYLIRLSGSEGVRCELYSDETLTERVWETDNSYNSYDEVGWWRFNLAAGTTYWLRAYGEGYGAASFDLSVRCPSVEETEISVGEYEQVDIPEAGTLLASFEVPEDGEYLVEVTGSEGILAELYETPALKEKVQWLKEGFPVGGRWWRVSLTAGLTYWLSLYDKGYGAVSVNLRIRQVKLEKTELNTSERTVINLGAGERFVGSFTAQEDGTYIFSSEGDGDTIAELYEDESLTTLLASNDDDGEGQNFSLTYHLAAGDTVYLVASLLSTDAGNFSVTVKHLTVEEAEISVGEERQVELPSGSLFLSALEVIEDGEYLVYVSGAEDVLAEMYVDRGLSERAGCLDEGYRDGGRWWRFHFSAGTTYWLGVRGDGYDAASFALSVRRSEIVESGLSVDESMAVELEEGEALVASFEVPEDGEYSIAVFGTDDAMIELYADDSLTERIQLLWDGYSDGGCWWHINLVAGSTYWLSIRDRGYGSVSLGLCVGRFHAKEEVLLVDETRTIELGDGECLAAAFEVPEDGEYLIEVSSSVGIVSELYADSSLTESVWDIGNSYHPDGGAHWWRYDLTAGSTYWLRACGVGYGAASLTLRVRHVGVVQSVLVVGEPKPLETSDGESIVASFKVSEDGEYLVEACGSAGISVELYCDSALSNVQWERESAYHSASGVGWWRFNLSADRTYWLRVYGEGYSASSFDVCVRKAHVTSTYLTVGQQENADLESGDRFVGIFTAPRTGTYAFVGEGGATASLYADSELSEFISYDFGRTETGFTIEHEMTIGETVYLNACMRPALGGRLTVTPSIIDVDPDQHRDGWINLSNNHKGYVKNGALVFGWMDLGSSKYYFQPDGAMSTGWTDVVVGGKLMHYYFNPASGNLVRGTWFQIDGRTYYFRPSGNLATGWATISDKGVDKKYYLDEDGQLLTGWQDIDVNGKLMHYYFRPSGSMATGWATIDGQKYWFRPSGNMATGWADVDDAYKRYFDAEGHMLTGWQRIGPKTYYFRASGAMQTGAATIGGVDYSFSDKGVLQG